MNLCAIVFEFFEFYPRNTGAVLDKIDLLEGFFDAAEGFLTLPFGAQGSEYALLSIAAVSQLLRDATRITLFIHISKTAKLCSGFFGRLFGKSRSAQLVF